jgi:hypothetical protein
VTRVSSKVTRVSSKVTRVSSKVARVSSKVARVSSKVARVSSKVFYEKIIYFTDLDPLHRSYNNRFAYRVPVLCNLPHQYFS